MSENKSLKSYIEELIQEVEKELDEANVTGNVDGYQTPHAFSRKSDNERRKKTATQFGYELVDNDVNNIDESVNEVGTGDWHFKAIQKLYQKAGTFGRKKIAALITKNPNSSWDKIEKELKGSDYDDVTYYTDMLKLESVVNKMKSVNEAAMNPVKKVVNAILKKHKVDAMKTTSTSVRGFHNIKNGGYKYEGNYFLQFYKVPQDTIVKIAAEMKKAGVKGVQVNMGNISADYTKTGLTNSQFEATINENRWLELKNDDSMHANKKLAVGLKELKYQLAEVEKFFSWYNKIKNINELDSDNYWKRTNTHIYKIKERLINIARTLQEIEK